MATTTRLIHSLICSLNSVDVRSHKHARVHMHVESTATKMVKLVHFIRNRTISIEHFCCCLQRANFTHVCWLCKEQQFDTLSKLTGQLGVFNKKKSKAIDCDCTWILFICVCSIYWVLKCKITIAHADNVDCFEWDDFIYRNLN